MRSVFVVSILAFLAVAAGGYGISWYGQASETKRSIEQMIEQINAKQKYITYDTIETSGFPSEVYVSIVRPHFKGRIDELLKNVKPPVNQAAPAAPAPQIQQWDEDALLDGKITFGVNTFSDHYTMTINGDWKRNTILNGKALSSISQQSGPTTCSLQFQRDTGIFDDLWNFHALNRDGKTLLKNFRMFDCNSAGQKSLETATQGVLSSIGPVRIYATSAPEKANQKIRFYFTVADMEVTPLGDAQLADYYHAISPSYDLPINFSSYGKQNIDLDFTYNGPADWQVGQKNPNVDVSLNKFDITNQIYNAHSGLHLSNIPSGNTRSSALAFHSEAEFSEQYDALMQAVIHNFIKKLYDSNSPQLQQTKALVQKYTPEELYSIVYPAIPNFHNLGKVALQLDGSFKGSAETVAGDYVLNQFQAAATPYGLNAKGNLKVATHLPSEGNMLLNCVNCLKMIDDMYDYEGRLQKALSYFNPEKANSWQVYPDQIDGVKKFLAALATPDPAAPTTFSYAIVSSSTGMSINGKTMADVAALYNEFIRPTMRQPAAPVTITPQR